MDSVLILDAARAGHMVGLAAGLGLALCADLLALRSVVKPVTDADVWIMWRLHRIILVGLAILWGSGLYLLQARTGWDPAAFSPKLVTKLAIVSVLTINAIVIGFYALPQFARNRGRRFGEFEPRTRLRLSVIAGVSLSCWMSALGLGVFSQLKPMSFGSLQAVFAPVFLTGLAGAVIVGLCATAIARLSGLASKKRSHDRDWPTDRNITGRPTTTLQF